MKLLESHRQEIARYFDVEARNLTQILDINLPTSEGPKSSVIFRIKTDASIAGKLKVRGISEWSESDRLNDFVGIRLVLSHSGLLSAALDLVRNWSRQLQLVEIGFSDRFSKNDKSLYRSLHLDFSLPKYLEKRVGKGLGLEVQITTYLQHFHSLVSHQLIYRHGLIDPIESRFIDDLQDMSRSLLLIDEMVAGIFKSIQRDGGTISKSESKKTL